MRISTWYKKNIFSLYHIIIFQIILNIIFRKDFLVEKLFIHLPFDFSGDFGYEQVRVFLEDGGTSIYDRVKTNTTVYWPCVVAEAVVGQNSKKQLTRFYR